MTNLETAIKKTISELPGEVGLFVKYLDTQETIEINPDQTFWAASTIKIAILIELFRQISEGSISFDQKHQVLGENRVRGSGIIHLLDKNTEFTTLDLAKLMMILSDNAATNQLVDLTGWENVDANIHKLGLEQTTFKHKMFIKAGRGPNLTTAREMSILLELLHNQELPDSELALEIMNEAKQRNRIAMFLPNELKISHKTGTSMVNDARVIHDVGIVYSEKPFIFSFLSGGQENSHQVNQIIGTCAKLCLEYANAK